MGRGANVRFWFRPVISGRYLAGALALVDQHQRTDQ